MLEVNISGVIIKVTRFASLCVSEFYQVNTLPFIGWM